MLFDGARRRVATWAVLLVAFGIISSARPSHAFRAFAVTTTEDSDPGQPTIDGSLRWAIEQANLNPGADGITFDIGATGVATIAPRYPLPAITELVTIDATGHTIELAGTNGVGIGLDVETTSNTITGLVINRFAYGIKVGAGGSATIVRCLIGTDPTGMVAEGNTSAGVLVSGTASFGDYYEQTQRNTVISGNGVGVDVRDGGTAYVFNVLVGTNAAGDTALPNVVGLRATAAYLGVYANYYGVDGVISGNTGDGVVYTMGSNGYAGTGSYKGPKIGLNAAGTTALPNGGVGVRVENAPSFSIYSSSISSNGGTGVLLTGSTASISYSSISSNAGAGVLLTGSTATITDSSISGNGGAGVLVDGGSTATITGNLIFGNAALGIDLLPSDGTHGVTPNDAFPDADEGGSGLQNHPRFDGPGDGFTSGRRLLNGRLVSKASTPYTLEFFSNLSCDASGFGQGMKIESTNITQVTTGPNGVALFTADFGTGVPVGTVITATATGPEGTSEFSPCVGGATNTTTTTSTTTTRPATTTTTRPATTTTTRPVTTTTTSTSTTTMIGSTTTTRPGGTTSTTTSTTATTVTTSSSTSSTTAGEATTTSTTVGEATTTSTTVPHCGNGIVEPERGEQCDPGGADSPDRYCCYVPSCRPYNVGAECGPQRQLGACETGDRCNPSGKCVPSIKPVGTQCRDPFPYGSDHPCDLGDVCDGVSPDCPMTGDLPCGKADRDQTDGKTIDVLCRAPKEVFKVRPKCTAVGLQAATGPSPSVARAVHAASVTTACGKKQVSAKVVAPLKDLGDPFFLQRQVKLRLNAYGKRLLAKQRSLDVCVLVKVTFGKSTRPQIRRETVTLHL